MLLFHLRWTPPLPSSPPRGDGGGRRPAQCLWAATPWERARGLIASDPLPEGMGLWLPGTTAIHMFGMTRSIDVAFLSADGAILSVHSPVRPWTMLWGPRGSGAALETEVGGLSAARPGDQVLLEACDA